MSGDTDVLVWSEGAAGRIHLNRPRAMNALDNGMVRVILRAMTAFEAREDIRALVVTAEGERSFCAGGDLKEIYRLAREDRELAVRIWSEEYILNARIASCSKPWICLVDGLCMGAGMAMAVHGQAAVLSEDTQLSMPELRIGFYPDVGVTFRLSRLPARLGFYFALSGQPIPPMQAVGFGLADAVVPRSLHGEVVAGIARGADLGALIEDLAIPPQPADPTELAGFCEDVFSASTWEECGERIAAHRSHIGELFRATISGFSPAALELAFKALVNARGLADVSQCLRRDMMLNAVVLGRHDFYEGVRSQLFARGTQPVWQDDPVTAWPPELDKEEYEPLHGVAFPCL